MLEIFLPSSCLVRPSCPSIRPPAGRLNPLLGQMAQPSFVVAALRLSPSAPNGVRTERSPPRCSICSFQRILSPLPSSFINQNSEPRWIEADEMRSIKFSVPLPNFNLVCSDLQVFLSLRLNRTVMERRGLQSLVAAPSFLRQRVTATSAALGFQFSIVKEVENNQCYIHILNLISYQNLRTGRKSKFPTPPSPSQRILRYAP